MFLRDYEYVVELAKTGSVLKAAQNLCISSSALSKYIRNIEDDLGLELFQRGGKIFTLTYAGERYLSWAKEILIQNQGLEKEMLSLRHQQSGRIRLGFPRVGAPLVINTILPRFREKHPNISLALYENSSGKLTQMLADNELDMIMTQMELDREKFEHIVLNQGELVLVVNRDHPLSQSGVPKPGFRYPWVDLRLFARDQFVLLHQSHKGDELIQETFEQHQISPSVAFRSHGIETCLMAVAQGLGVTITSADSAVRDYGFTEKAVVLSFGEYPQRFDRLLVYRRGAYLGTAEKDLIQLLQGLDSVERS